MCMSTQFALGCHASIVWFKRNNEKLKGKSATPLFKWWKFHRTECKPRISLICWDDCNYKPFDLLGLKTCCFLQSLLRGLKSINLNILPFTFCLKFRITYQYCCAYLLHISSCNLHSRKRGSGSSRLNFKLLLGEILTFHKWRLM